MREVHELQLDIGVNTRVDDVVDLVYDQRQKSRQKITTRSGAVLGLFLPRGTILRHGDVLLADDGSCIRVEAAPEELSVIESDDHFQLLRAAYHLGNRHVMLQIAPGRLAYQHDHVLDDMVRGLGLNVACVTAPFHPEAGAYHGGDHGHDQGHGHSHAHGHHGHSH
jgi:urease accessory protein